MTIEQQLSELEAAAQNCDIWASLPEVGYSEKLWAQHQAAKFRAVRDAMIERHREYEREQQRPHWFLRMLAIAVLVSAAILFLGTIVWRIAQ